MNEVYEIVRQGLSALLLVSLPVVAASALAGLLVSILQTATNIHEPASLYAARLLAVVLVLYIMFHSFSDSIVSLAQLAFR